MNTHLKCFDKDNNLIYIPSILYHTLITINSGVISAEEAAVVSKMLQFGDVTIQGDKITVHGQVIWEFPNDLMFYSKGNVVFDEDAKLVSKAGGSVHIKSGIGSTSGDNKVVFESTNPQITFESKGQAHIYYNPEIKPYSDHKYHNPSPYFKHVNPPNACKAYMLVNTVEDLQSIRVFLHGNYALSRNIDASITKDWNNGKGFTPLYLEGKRPVPFSGHFDGNGFTISGLFINHTEEKNIGLFGIVAGQKNAPATVKNLKMNNITIEGGHYVGFITGDAEYARIENIDISNSTVSGIDIVGGIAGTAKDVTFSHLFVNARDTNINAVEYKGLLLGSAQNIIIDNSTEVCVSDEVQCIGYSQDVQIFDYH